MIFRGQDDICTVMVAAHLEQLYFRFGFRNVGLFRVKKRKKLLLRCFPSKHFYYFLLYLFFQRGGKFYRFIFQTGE